MGLLHGALGLPDTDRSFVRTIGQKPVFDAIQSTVELFNQNVMNAMSIFVDGSTTDYTWRYYLPGGGYLNKAGLMAQPASVKATGSWDVSLPLDDFRVSMVENDIAAAYMSIDQLDRHYSSVRMQYSNTVRREILSAVFRNTTRTYVDPLYGSLTVQPLANGDSVTYPPLFYSTAEATENLYLESGYTAANISDTNNPYVTIKDKLEARFGYGQGGTRVVVFIHRDQIAKTEALTEFVPAPDFGVAYGDQVSLLGQFPPALPGRVIGRVSGVWVVEWSWIPSGYLFGMHLDAPKPLSMRVDDPDTGLGNGGLTLVSQDNDFPFDTAIWRARFGFGVSNRLNGCVMELGIGGTYTAPTIT